jgi:hypothetical protein
MAASTDGQLTVEDEKLRAIYGTFYSKSANYPHSSHLAILVEGEARLEARVLSLPALQKIDTHLFAPVALMPRPHAETPGRIDRISMFNIIVVVLILVLAAGMTRLIIWVKQYIGKKATAPFSIKNKFFLFAGALLITLLLHFAATICFIIYTHDELGETAVSIAQQAVERRFAALGYTVEVKGGSISIIGSSPLWLIDFPYQVLYWRWSDFTRFAAPVEIGVRYELLDRYGRFARREEIRYYVFGVNRLVLSRLPPG